MVTISKVKLESLKASVEMDWDQITQHRTNISKVMRLYLLRTFIQLQDSPNHRCNICENMLGQTIVL